ncbi:MAG: DEAD/DEAH box helicase [Synechococcus sp. SB0668_bin_15]|nr:DEAD/DEAH box helicase [Synechococcus sp. SB0668_bin_15]MXZ83128.1 DEAD/DEAH box helicase [Synechococcus sp. SB0666_bin_14]MYC50476.1 DEAD/DEAH box helicase [Synechococcus sp. SB0662_bin_14]MYG46140.1 DEAD/DEAH box helicase [Synechococcus sp. SB0675_bin_6]MYJ59285.1 DEAD/DEAH box helicase [Synechococcus sp. SB0672_bin_6]
MPTDSWITASIGAKRLQVAQEEATRRRLGSALGVPMDSSLADDDLRFVINALELRVAMLLDHDDGDELREAAAQAFQLARALLPASPAHGKVAEILRVACLGVLGDRGADVRRILADVQLPAPVLAENWGLQVEHTIQDVWLRLLRKQGWDELDGVQKAVARLRAQQHEGEATFLAKAERNKDARPAWELMSQYHLAKAAEILGAYITQGSVDGRFDVRQQIEAQFDRAVATAARGQLMEREMRARLLARTAHTLIDNSIWTVTRAVNSRVTKFVQSVVDRERAQPMFEMLPPQRRTLREEGLLGSGHRAVVVSLPTSSGKTLIAEFRMLQALNQFDHERGWVAYLAPTRALVNQLAVRLRRDFAPLDVVVEKVSPALEVDGIEADMLTDEDKNRQFRVLVTTPEKLDLMLRGDWEAKIGRPLTLVVVDEAHNLAAASGGRGLKLELLLATMNRECRFAQFLLLTPFIPNAAEIAQWLSPDSNKTVELSMDWSPNDRVIAVAEPVKGAKRGDFAIQLVTQHTTRHTLSLPDEVKFQDSRLLNLKWSDVSSSPGKLAAATAQVLRQRGTVIVLVDKPHNSWGVAKALTVEDDRLDTSSGDLAHIRLFLEDEMGKDFPLATLLDYGIGVHHSGLSEDTRTLVEWLTEQGMLKVLVATTTIAQGVNFPVAGVVFASHQYPYGQDMPPEDFWNIAGRAGRVDQGDLGIIALAGNDREKSTKLKQFIGQSVSALNSTLIDLVLELKEAGELLKLESLAWKPGWSSFLQYLAHTYRQIGDHERFAAEVEQVLRGTLGFQELRKSHKELANALVDGVYRYAEKIKGKPLKLVDATGFSWESVSNTLRRLGEERIMGEVWSPDLFTSRWPDLQRMVGVLLEVPELRQQLKDFAEGGRKSGDVLARIVSDWVQGRPLPEMAKEYFKKNQDSDSVNAMTQCCRDVFGRITQTASWGLAALQSLTMKDTLESMPADEQRTVRNLPAWVYYGVNSDEAVALRLLGVPRTAAAPLATTLGVISSESLNVTREKLRTSTAETWRDALGQRGDSYHRVWSIIEGN